MIRFAVITDVQYGNLDDHGTRTYRESISKFLRAAGEIAAEEVLFTLQLGDASQSDWENHLAIKELFDAAEKAGIKWKHVLGNHDFLVNNEKKLTFIKILVWKNRDITISSLMIRKTTQTFGASSFSMETKSVLMRLNHRKKERKRKKNAVVGS